MPKSKPWTDAAGRTLADYPRPSVAVDTAVMTVPTPLEEGQRLHVLVHRRADAYHPGEWSLPGTFVHPGERLADAVLRCLHEKVGLRGEQPSQLCVLDDPLRDDRGWVMSVAHVDLVPFERMAPLLSNPTVRLVPVTGSTGHIRLGLPDRQRRLPFDHDDIVERAVAWARARYADTPDPDRLLDEPFTMLDLRLLHEAVAGAELQKDTFRRRREPQLTATGQRRHAVGKPAMLYRH